MMSLTFGLFTQVSGSGPLGPLVSKFIWLGFYFQIEHFPLGCPSQWRGSSETQVPVGRAGTI